MYFWYSMCIGGTSVHLPRWWTAMQVTLREEQRLSHQQWPVRLNSSAPKLKYVNINQASFPHMPFDKNLYREVLYVYTSYSTCHSTVHFRLMVPPLQLVVVPSRPLWQLSVSRAPNQQGGSGWARWGPLPARWESLVSPRLACWSRRGPWWTATSPRSWSKTSQLVNLWFLHLL